MSSCCEGGSRPISDALDKLVPLAEKIHDEVTERCKKLGYPDWFRQCYIDVSFKLDGDIVYQLTMSRNGIYKFKKLDDLFDLHRRYISQKSFDDNTEFNCHCQRLIDDNM